MDCTTMRRRFFTLDVFTDQRLVGNPLAVVLQPDGLDQAAMQAIAGEFNLPETVFVLPPDDPAHRARCRIFTPKRELPFAGHPTVGTSVLLGCLDGGQSPRGMILEETIGPVLCHVAPAEGAGYASFDLPALPTEASPPPSAAALAGALGLSVEDIGFGKFITARWSAGNPFIFVPLRSLAAVQRAKPDSAQFASALGDPAVYVFANQTVERGRHFHARMFAPGMGIIEDPATGSAAAAFAGVVARFAGLKDGKHDIAVEQGYEMGRPSLIHLGMTLANGVLTAASIGGDAVMVSEGTIEA
jgi:trans-2,3-dihydro-3-hydroxyanthranilate isomerase